MTIIRRPGAVLALPLLLACSTSEPVTPTPEPCGALRVVQATRPISPERLAARREAALDSIGAGVLIVSAGWEMDNAVGDAERQRTDFYYLTGLEHEGEGWLVLIAAPGGGHSERLYLPGTDDDVATVPAEDATGVQDVRCKSNARAQLLALLASDSVPSEDVVMVSLDDDDELDDLLDDADIDAGSAELLSTHLRAVKDDQEIAIMEEAARVSAEALLRGMKAAEPGGNEADVEQAIHDYMMDRGATRLAFGHIVASGANALEFHYKDNDDALDAGELIVVDVGAELGRYAADVARTFPASGTFTPRQRELYDFLLTAVEAGIEAAHVGGSMAGVHGAIHARLAQSGDLCGDQTCDHHLGHMGGHYVGLDVHDGIYSANWMLPLRPGSILNVEPGIYLPAEGIGLRIEETVLVTEDGPRVLSVGVPLTAAEIEAAMATP